MLRRAEEHVIGLAEPVSLRLWHLHTYPLDHLRRDIQELITLVLLWFHFTFLHHIFQFDPHVLLRPK